MNKTKFSITFFIVIASVFAFLFIGNLVSAGEKQLAFTNEEMEKIFKKGGWNEVKLQDKTIYTKKEGYIYKDELKDEEFEKTLLDDNEEPKDIKLGGRTGPTRFTGLSDTPDSYSGTAGQLCTVNSAEDAIEFSSTLGTPSAPLTVGYFTDLVASTTVTDVLQIRQEISPGPLTLATSSAVVDFHFKYDTGTGVNSSAYNELALWTGNSPRLTIDSSGNVTGQTAGFKITGGSATTADLSLQTTSGVGATGADMHFLVGNAGATEAMTILNSGNVGIGTDSPDDKLHVTGTALTSTILERTTASTNDNLGTTILRLTTSGDMLDDFGPGFGFQIKDDADADRLIATIYGVRDSADTEGALVFKAGTNGVEEFMRIANVGYVGIGEVSPETLLELTSTAPYLTLHNSTAEDSDGGRESQLLFKGHQSGDEETTLAKIQPSHDGALDDQSGDLIFFTNDGSDGNSPTERLRIDSGGNVGIGATDPTKYSTGAKLDVAFGGLSLVLGADSGATTRTNSTSKIARIANYHHTNAEEPVGLIYGNMGATVSSVFIGGGTSSVNAATNIQLFTAAGTTTTTGTQRIMVTSAGFIGINETDPETILEIKSSIPYLTLHNSTTEDTEGGRESKLLFKGRQSGAEETTLAKIQASHDGTSDDQKGDLILSTNDGTDGDSPTEAMRIDSARNVGIGTSTPAYDLDVYGTIRADEYVYEDGTYCNIYATDTATTTQAIATGVTYTKVENFTNDGESSNCTNAYASNKITITKAGRYRIEGAFSFEGDNNNVIWRGAVFINGVEQNQAHWKRKIATGGDIGNAGFTGIVHATTTPVDLDFRLRHDKGGNENITFEYMSLNANYLGE